MFLGILVINLVVFCLFIDVIFFCCVGMYTFLYGV